MSSEPHTAEDAGKDAVTAADPAPAFTEVAAPATEVHGTASFSSDPPAAERIPDAAPAPDAFAAVSGPSSSADAGGPAAAAQATIESLSDRPEVMAGAAFAGGLLVALILKRLGR